MQIRVTEGSDDEGPPSVGLHIDFAIMDRIMTTSVVCEILGMVLILLILLLSISRRSTSQVNAVPRIFTVNLMLVNLVHSLFAFLNDYSYINRKFTAWLMKIGLYQFVWTRGFDVQRTSFLVFCSSFVPMMLVTIAACFHNRQLARVASPLIFTVVVLVSDGVPIAFQVLNLSIFASPGGGTTWEYVAFGLILYFSQIALTVVALWLLYRRMAHISKTATVDKFQQNLRRFLLFSIAPNLVLMVFAASQVSLIFRSKSQFLMNLDGVIFDVQHVVMAIKPTIDALSTLLFLGEYRQHLGAASLFVGRWLVSKGQDMTPPTASVAPTRSTSLIATHMQSNQQRKLSNMSTRSAWT